MNYNWLKATDCKERDAFYQAGHAVIALQEALEVVRIFIEDDGSSWIEVQYPDLSQSRLSRSVRARSDARAVIRALLAGPAAQLRYSFGTSGPDHPLPDFNLANRDMLEHDAIWQAISLAIKISGDSRSLIRSSWRRVNRLVHGNRMWPAMEAVANALLLNGELAGCEVRDLARFGIDPKLGL
jgi:hypothetical protein